MNGGIRSVDVIVVGAGPAGSTAARHCALKGLQTVLLEKAAMPRTKPCAGGVTVAAARELGCDIPQHVIERKCSGLHIVFRGVDNTVDYHQPITFMVRRSVFDQYLADIAVKAGALLSDKETCIGAERQKHWIVVDTNRRRLRAPVVIGADGYFSRIRKSLDQKFDGDEIRFCVFAEIPMHPHEIDNRYGNTITIHYGFIPRGYAWIFPKGSHVNTGAGGTVSQGSDLLHGFRAFLSQNRLDHTIRLRGCFIPVSRWRRNMYADRVLLAGDAAGLVDSFSGEGIRFAVASGKLAAETATAAHRVGAFDRGILCHYQTRCMEHMGRDLQKSNSAADLVHKNPNLLVGSIVRNRDAIFHYMRTITGEISFSEYASWIKGKIPRYLLKRLFHW
jgi:geranylgeranyl reductase family protein